MPFRSFCTQCLLFVLTICLGIGVIALPAQAASVDSYVMRYLVKSGEPVSLSLDGQTQTQFSAEALSQGKRLFEENCKNCHVGGATLPDPLVSLSLSDLKGATPPRDNINNLIAYFRHPMVYDGTEETFWCREVPESWMSQAQVEDLAAFILRAAEVAPGWGTDRDF